MHFIVERERYFFNCCLFVWLEVVFEVGGLAADYDLGRTMDRLISRSLSSLGDETELHLRRLAFIHKLETKSSAIRERERDVERTLVEECQFETFSTTKNWTFEQFEKPFFRAKSWR